MEHELAYLRHIEKLGFRVSNLRATGNEEEAIAETTKITFSTVSTVGTIIPAAPMF
jgi:hypothetical protein